MVISTAAPALAEVFPAPKEPAWTYAIVPGPMHARCAITKGDRLPLAALNAGDVLVFHTMSQLDHWLSAENERALRGGRP